MKKYLIIYNAYFTSGNLWLIEHKYATISTFSEVVRAKDEEHARNNFMKDCKKLNYRAEIIDISEAK